MIQSRTSVNNPGVILQYLPVRSLYIYVLYIYDLIILLKMQTIFGCGNPQKYSSGDNHEYFPKTLYVDSGLTRHVLSL